MAATLGMNEEETLAFHGVIAPEVDNSVMMIRNSFQGKMAWALGEGRWDKARSC